MSEQPMVFISHKHSDAEIARTLADFLVTHSGNALDVHLSSAPEFSGPRLGEDVSKELNRALAKSDLVILVYTQDTEDWDWCMFECGVATDPEDEQATSVVVLQCTSDEPRPFAGRLHIDARDLNSVEKFVKELLTTSHLFAGRHEPITQHAPEGPNVKEYAAELHTNLINAVKSERVETELDAYEVLLASLAAADFVYSVTVSAPDAPIAQRVEPVAEVRNRYFERKEELLASGDLEEWRELFVGPELPSELVEHRRQEGGGRYRARYIEADGSVPIVGFSLFDSRAHGQDGVMGWHSLVFGGGSRSGTFLRLSDKRMWALQREYFDLLWERGEDVLPSQHE